MNLTKKTYCVRDITGVYRSVRHDELVSSARSAVINELKTYSVTLGTPQAVRDHLAMLLAELEYEVFAVLLVDAQNQLIHYEELFRGTIDGASVYPRNVVKFVLDHNAAAVIFCHNHPSGIAEPSQADHRITERLKQALGLIDVRVLDHLIVAGNETLSFAERGWL